MSRPEVTLGNNTLGMTFIPPFIFGELNLEKAARLIGSAPPDMDVRLSPHRGGGLV